MLVRVLLCTLYTTCFGPDQCHPQVIFQHKIYLKAVTNISIYLIDTRATGYIPQ
jgi:hypothetical protein